MTVHSLGDAIECDGCGREVILEALRPEYSHPRAESIGALRDWVKLSFWPPGAPSERHVNLCPSCAATTTVAALHREASEEES